MSQDNSSEHFRIYSYNQAIAQTLDNPTDRDIRLSDSCQKCKNICKRGMCGGPF